MTINRLIEIKEISKTRFKNYWQDKKTNKVIIKSELLEINENIVDNNLKIKEYFPDFIEIDNSKNKISFGGNFTLFDQEFLIKVHLFKNSKLKLKIIEIDENSNELYQIKKKFPIEEYIIYSFVFLLSKNN